MIGLLKQSKTKKRLISIWNLKKLKTRQIKTIRIVQGKSQDRSFQISDRKKRIKVKQENK